VHSQQVGTVYVMNNGVAPLGNQIIHYPRYGNGSLGPATLYATGGVGNGDDPTPIPIGPRDPLRSQHALILNRANTLIYAVNAGDNTVSVLTVGANGALTLKNVFDSGGEYPISMALSNDELTLYVLNAGALGRLVSIPVGRRSRNYSGPNSFVTIGIERAFFPVSSLEAVGDVITLGDRWVLVSEKYPSKVRAFRTSLSGRLLPTQRVPPVVYDNTRGWSWAFWVVNPTLIVLTTIPTGPRSDPFNTTSNLQALRFDPLTGSLTLLSELTVDGSLACWLVRSSLDYYYVVATGAPFSFNVFQVNNVTGTVSLATPAGNVPGHAIENQYFGGDAAATTDGYIYMYGNGIGVTDRATVATLFAFRAGADGALTEVFNTNQGHPIQGCAAY